MATRKNYNTFSDQAPSRPEPDGAQRDTEAEPLLETAPLIEAAPLSDTTPLLETDPLLETAASKVPDNFLGHATLLDTYYPDKLRYYVKPYQLAVIIIGILSFGGATSTGFYEYYYNGKQILFDS